MCQVSSESLKNQGNCSFRAGDYESAVKHYTDAIGVDNDNDNAVLYSNRAMTYIKLLRLVCMYIQYNIT